MKFKSGDIVKCRGEHFTEREILPDRHGSSYRYKTRFVEDGFIVFDDAKIIDDNYELKTDGAETDLKFPKGKVSMEREKENK